MDMTNETVGDAYSDMLIVETVLCERGWNMSDWYNTYSDLPNRLTKVIVKVTICLDLMFNNNINCEIFLILGQKRIRNW